MQYHVSALERYHQVFQRNIFDVSSSSEDVIKLILNCTKALVEACLGHQSELTRISQHLQVVSMFEKRVKEIDRVTNLINETVKRVNFLWASQGLGDLSITPNSLRPTRDKGATPQAAEIRTFLEDAARTPPPQSSAPAPQAVTSSEPPKKVEEGAPQDAAAAAVLHSSEATRVLVEQQLQYSREAHQTAAFDDRLRAVEDCSGVFHRGFCKLETDIQKLALATDDTNHTLRSLEHRFSINVKLLDDLKEGELSTTTQRRKDVDALKNRVVEMQREMATIHSQTEQMVERTVAHDKEIASLQQHKTAANDVRSIVAKELAEGPVVVQCTRDVSTLYTLFDINRNDAAATVSRCEASQTTNAKGGRQRAVAGERGGTDTTAQECLKLVHGGLPFRTVLSAMHTLAESVKVLQAQPPAFLVQPITPPAPLIGLELADSPDGVTVKRIFEGLPAAKAGLRVGDLIVAVNAQAVRQRQAFQQISAIYPCAATTTSPTRTIGRIGNVVAQLSFAVIRSGALAEHCLTLELPTNATSPPPSVRNSTVDVQL